MTLLIWLCDPGAQYNRMLRPQDPAVAARVSQHTIYHCVEGQMLHWTTDPGRGGTSDE